MKNAIITVEGREFKLIDDLYLYVNLLSEDYVESTAICLQDIVDSYGWQPTYRVVWRVNYEIGESEDFANVCDWENPDDLYEYGEYNAELNRFC